MVDVMISRMLCSTDCTCLNRIHMSVLPCKRNFVKYPQYWYQLFHFCIKLSNFLIILVKELFDIPIPYKNHYFDIL